MGTDSHLPSHPGPSFYIDPVNRENFDSAAKPSPPVPSTFCTAAGVRSTLAAVLRLARSPPVDSISLDTPESKSFHLEEYLFLKTMKYTYFG